MRRWEPLQNGLGSVFSTIAEGVRDLRIPSVVHWLFSPLLVFRVFPQKTQAQSQFGTLRGASREYGQQLL
jgi:hypothetical protein